MKKIKTRNYTPEEADRIKRLSLDSFNGVRMLAEELAFMEQMVWTNPTEYGRITTIVKEARRTEITEAFSGAGGVIKVTKKFQVWCTAIIVKGKQRSAIVAAPSRREAARLMGIKDHDLATYGSPTANKENIQTAMSKPGTVFCTDSMNYPHIYKPMPSLVKER